MAHLAACARSVLTPRDDCSCKSCNKKLHGIPHSERIRAFAQKSPNLADAAQISGQFRDRLVDATPVTKTQRATDFLGAKLTEEAIGTQLDPNKVTEAVTRAALDTLLDGANRHSLSDAARRRIQKRFLEDHLFCSLFVLLLRGWALLGQARDDFRDQIIESLLTAVFGPPNRSTVSLAVRSITRGAFVAGFDAGVAALGALAPTTTWEHAMQFGGAVTCPDADTHPANDVVVYCLLPLLKLLVLGKPFTDWITTRFTGPIPV